MGAAYGLQSRAGRGSRFWLRLPAHQAARPTDAVAPPEMARDATEPRALHGRCLVLDDDPQVIKAWRAMFDAWGVTAAFAASGAEAHARLDAGFAPDAIFCDQRLGPGDSGFAVLRQLLARCPQASGAMVSGELLSAELAQAEDEGYVVLRKPLDPATLRPLLETWLTQRQAPAEPAIAAP
jgi:CheY-like chemotaxis protein